MNRNNSDRFWQFFKFSPDKGAKFGNIKVIQIPAIIFFGLMLGVFGNTENTLVGVSMKLNEKDSGKTVEMLVGDELEVVLPGNPTTGYAWELILLDSNILKPEKTEFFANNKTMGSGGVEIIKFHAIAAGKSELKLIFHRSFEPNVPPLKTFETTVIVKKPLSD